MQLEINNSKKIHNYHESKEAQWKHSITNSNNKDEYRNKYGRN